MKKLMAVLVMLALSVAFASGENTEIQRLLPDTSAQEAAPQAYILRVVDQYDAPVPGVMVIFCADTVCMLRQGDENGIVSFDGAPDIYHVQLLTVPEGYSFDPDLAVTTDAAYGEWVLRIRKD